MELSARITILSLVCLINPGASSRGLKTKINSILSNVEELKNHQGGVDIPLCSWTCFRSFIVAADTCKEEFSPTSQPEDFVACVVKILEKDGCLSCACDLICENYPQACEFCRNFNHPFISRLEAVPSFTIKNNFNVSIFGKIDFFYPQCNFQTVEISPGVTSIPIKILTDTCTFGQQPKLYIQSTQKKPILCTPSPFIVNPTNPTNLAVNQPANTNTCQVQIQP